MISVAKGAATSWVKPSLPDSDSLETRDSDDEETAHDEKHTPDQRISQVMIQPIRSTISTLGKGELSLDSLENSNRGRRVSSDIPRSASAQLNLSSNLRDSSSVGPISRPNSFLRSSRTDSAIADKLKDNESGVTNGQLTDNQRLSAMGSPNPGFSDRDASRDGKLRRRSLNRNPERSDSVRSSTGRKVIADSISSEEPILTERRLSQKKPKSGRKGHIGGFAFADRKRNREFHKIFKSIPAEDYLLDDFGCALSRDILLQGRLYVSEGNLCFNANILGWVTNLVIAFDEVVSLEKKNTAGLFPNGIVVQTLHARHSFASFISRDSTFEFIKSIWKQSGMYKNQSTNDQVSSDSFDSESDGSFESDEDDDTDSDIDGSSDNVEADIRTKKKRATSFGDVNSESSLSFSSDDGASDVSSSQEFEGTARQAPAEKENSQSTEESATGGDTATDNKWPVPNLGPETHEPTKVPPPSAENEKILFADTISAPLGVVANLIYGDDTKWYTKFLTQRMKNTNLTEVTPMKDKQRKYEYIKPLNSSVGPKSTKCLCTETVEKWDMNSYVSVVQTTQTPNVPSGNSFLTKSRTILSWAEDNKTKITCSYWIEWSAKSWLKGPIERGAEDGQITSAKEIIAEMIQTMKSNSEAGAKRRPSGAKSKKPTKKKGREKKVRKEEPVVEPAQNTSGSVIQRLGSLAGSVHPIVWLVVILFIGIAIGRQLHQDPYASLATKDNIGGLRENQEYDMWKWIDDRAGRPITARTNREVSGNSLRYNRQELEAIAKITEHRLELLKSRLNLAHSEMP